MAEREGELERGQLISFGLQVEHVTVCVCVDISLHNAVKEVSISIVIS